MKRELSKWLKERIREVEMELSEAEGELAELKEALSGGVLSEDLKETYDADIANARIQTANKR